MKYLKFLRPVTSVYSQKLNTMTREQYIAQNARGFEGDEHLAAEFARLAKAYNINHIIETGTYRGHTARRLSQLAPVYTVEVVPENWMIAKETCKGLPVTCELGNSVDALRNWLPDLKRERLLIFLDAHWQQYNPLLDELAMIARFKIQPVIAIHDFKVPGTDLGYDSYNGQDYDFAWIEKSLAKVYPNGYGYHYNKEAEGARRGVIFIYPKPDDI